VRQIIEWVERITNKKLNVKIGNRRKGDPVTLIASSKKAEEVLGWRPECSDMETIVSSAYSWMKKLRQ